MADPQFLLDTNILVYLIGGRSETLRIRVERHAPGSLVTSTLCIAEAAYGLRKDRRVADGLARILNLVTAVPFDLAAAHRFSDVPFNRGKVDRFIAAQALAHSLIVVTNNESDFVDVPGLKVENWVKGG